MIALICVLTYFDVKLSARLLGIALLCEVDHTAGFRRLHIHRRIKQRELRGAFKPWNAFKGLPGGLHFGGTSLAAGAAGIGIFFAFWSWVGLGDGAQLRRGIQEPQEERARARCTSR